MHLPSKLWLLVAIIAYVAVGVAITSWRRNRHLRALAASREGESICQFVRSLDYRRLDTKVIRAVYESLAAWCTTDHRPLPIHITDTLFADLRLYDEDLMDVIGEVTERCGLSLDHLKRNPWYDRVDTAGDLVHFLCAQPKRPLWPAC